MRNAIAAVLVSLASIAGASGPDAGSSSAAKPALADLSWLAGSWHGEGLGGEIEEHWTDASGGTMLGVFRLVREGKIVIEYVLITQEDDRVAFRFKHFRPDYTTWEAEHPLEFDLISVSEREAVFHSAVPEQNSPRRITYRLTDDGDLLAIVAGSDDEGRLSDGFELQFSRR